jgi:hypothetical protein
MLACAKPLHGRFRRGVTRQVKTTDALHRHDETVRNRLRGLGDWVRCRATYRRWRRVFRPDDWCCQPDHFERRPARRTGGRLRVKTPIERVLVFVPARSAHLERRHRRGRAVVGCIGGDGETGAAVGAVGEGVSIAAIRGIENVANAVVTGGQVGRDRHAPFNGRLAVLDDEPGDRLGGNRDGVELLRFELPAGAQVWRACSKASSEPESPKASIVTPDESFARGPGRPPGRLRGRPRAENPRPAPCRGSGCVSHPQRFP